MIAPTNLPSSKPNGIALGSTISAVTVFRSGATVTREASLPAVATTDDGKASLCFDGLPLSLVDSSLRCRVLESAGTRASELRCELQLPAAESDAQVGISEERKTLEIQVEQLRGRLGFVQEEISLKLPIGERGKPALGDAPMSSPLAARTETLRALGQRSETLDSELRKLEEELRLAETRLEELEAAEAMASTDREARRGEMRKCVVVTLQGATKSPGGRIELEYFVPGARWAPSYALRLGPSLREGELAMRAMVSQHSGEDWAGVSLTLSTADHQAWAEIPELNSKRIGRRQPSPPKRGWRAPPTGAGLLYRDYDTSFGGPDEPMVLGAAVRATGEMRREEPTVSLAEDTAEFGVFDDEEDTGVLLSAEEFDDNPTAVMDEAVVDKEVSLPPEPLMASRSAIAQAPSRPKLKKRSRRPGAVGAAPGGYGGGRPAPQAPMPPPAPKVDLDRMQYTRLRMAGPGNHRRGSLRVCTQIELYAERFADYGEALDPQRYARLEEARYRAEDIASVPSGHSEPWSEEFDYAYRAENTVDLDSDGQYHSLPIAKDTADCVPRHVVVPRESTDVFRTVRVGNPMDAPLLAGPLDVYWDDAFLLTSSVAFTAPMGQVELGLGVDQAIKVVRNTHYREDTAGIMGGSLELSHKIVIEVANESGHQIDLEVRERVPVAAEAEDDIKLDIKAVSPMWSAFDPETKDARDAQAKGMFRWLLPLTAGERKELSATYEIKMPSKYELQGGNRREW